MKVLTAEVLPGNSAVLQVLGDAGLAVRRRSGNGVIELSMPVPQSAALGEVSAYLDAVAGPEQQAGAVSLQPLLAPRSAAVVGALSRPGSVGRRMLLNIRDAGFAGALHAVSSHAGDIEGIPCVASVAALPEAPDLAVVAVPAARVVEVARECGKRGARSLVVITPGLTSAQGSSLLEACRRAGMRLVGPNCFGVAVPGIGLDATFAMHHPSPGKAGLVVQSGGVGAALVEHFSRLGIGISSFVSVGDMLDVCGTDMLQWWEADNATELAVLYLESFGNPRRFARTARRVSAKRPVLTVHAGRSAPGQRAAASHTAAAAAPLITRQALFDQAGLIATAGFGELLDVAVLMASQPVPGPRRCSPATPMRSGSTRRPSGTWGSAAPDPSWPAPTWCTANGCVASAAAAMHASSCAPRTTCSPRWAPRRSPNGPASSCWPPANAPARGPPRPPGSSRRRRRRSPGWSAKARATGTSPRSCS